jgi:hypothetical protein
VTASTTLRMDFSVPASTSTLVFDRRRATRRPIQFPTGCIQESKEYQPPMHADARRCSVLA